MTDTVAPDASETGVRISTSEPSEATTDHATALVAMPNGDVPLVNRAEVRTLLDTFLAELVDLDRLPPMECEFDAATHSFVVKNFPVFETVYVVRLTVSKEQAEKLIADGIGEIVA